MSARIHGGHSMHEEHKPELCPGVGHRGLWRTVDCCGVQDDRDVIECSSCGKQMSVRCNFDDDFS